VPGIREHADRTLAEQMLGLDLALKEAGGKTVLDLGCAEGLIGREFARAGAIDVLGIDSLDTHLDVARQACADCPQMRFLRANLNHYIPAQEKIELFAIVLALGIMHKLNDPDAGLRFAARSCVDLLLYRPPAYAADGIVKSKRFTKYCHAPTVLREEGLHEERRIDGARGEHVEYWRRT
jgi:SAM-dependent methyltransferase